MSQSSNKESNQNNMRQQWSKIIAKCWNDEKFKERLLKNPQQVLKEEGINIPNDVKVNIHENSQETYHIILPAHTKEELSEEELKAFAGGYCNICGGPACASR